MKQKNLPAHALAGATNTRERVEHDYYATPPSVTMDLLNVVSIEGTVFEPACGEGHISKVLKESGLSVVSSDIVDRGYPGTIVSDFLSYSGEPFDNIVTNPPFKYAAEFVERGLLYSKDKLIILAKIQFLESIKRKKIIESSPLKYIYCFSRRRATWRNGEPLDENGKKWSTTMFLAWFVWEHGYTGEPIIRLIE